MTTAETTNKVAFGEFAEKLEEAKETEETTKLPIDHDKKKPCILNVEADLSDLLKSLAKKESIAGIEEEKMMHLPRSLTGVAVHYITEGIKRDFNLEFETQPVSLARRGKASAFDSKVSGKKRLLTRDQKNELLAKTQMSYYEQSINKGDMSIEQAMHSIRDAFERKQSFEEMGYILPPNKTDYPKWADKTEEGAPAEASA